MESIIVANEVNATDMGEKTAQWGGISLLRWKTCVDKLVFSFSHDFIALACYPYLHYLA